MDRKKCDPGGNAMENVDTGVSEKSWWIPKTHGVSILNLSDLGS